MQEPNRPGRCGAWSLVAEHDDLRVAIPLVCRSWDCPRCGPRQQHRLRALIAEAAPTKFMTLTCSRRAHPDRSFAYEALRVAWPKLVKRLRRYHDPEPVEFLWVLEGTRHGWPHYHVALRMPYTPQRILSRWWAELVASPIVDIRGVTSSSDAAWEVSKYLTKMLFAPAGFRRWGSSPGFLLQLFRPRPADDDDAPAWVLAEESTDALARAWTLEALIVVEGQSGTIVGCALEASAPGLLSRIRALLGPRPPPATGRNRLAGFMLLFAASSPSQEVSLGADA